MKVDSVRLDVIPAQDAAGNRVATEETPVQRVTVTRVPLSLSVPIPDPANPPKGMPEVLGAPRGTVPGEIVKNDTLGQVAAEARDRCKFCKHFSNDEWRKLLRKHRQEAGLGDKNAENFLAMMLEAIASRTIHGVNVLAGKKSAAADAMLKVPGLCRYWSREKGVATVTLPEQTCEKFSAPTREARHLAVAGYDEVMKAGETVAKKVVGK